MEKAEKLADLSLLDTNNQAARLGDLWTRSLTLIEFIRHFG
jgi:hypothetical protein